MRAGGEPPIVHTDPLQRALNDFLAQSAEYLNERIKEGSEVPFELASSCKSSRRTPLYSYRPLTGQFISEHFRALKSLQSFTAAMSWISNARGLERYLISHGMSRPPVTNTKCAEIALRMLLEDVYAEQSEFQLREDRLRQAVDRLGQSAGVSTEQITLLGTLHGLTLRSNELALTRGLRLIAPEALDELPEQVAFESQHPCLVVIFTSEDRELTQAISQGREVLRDLLSALRLFGDGRVSLGELAFSRVGHGSWSPVVLASRGRPHGMLVIAPEQEDELRAFCNLVSRRSPSENDLAWALDRFQIGCEQPTEYQALSDYLMALRALLEPEGPASGLLARRLSALCATPQGRQALWEKATKAIELERTVIAGGARHNTASDDLVRLIADHLRALLRDVICGHLEADLITLADELLTGESEQTAGAFDEQLIAQALGVSEKTQADAPEFSLTRAQQELMLAQADPISI